MLAIWQPDLNINQKVTSWNNPKGTADTERVMRAINDDLAWPYDWDNPFKVEHAVKKWVVAYNIDYPDQSISYQTPVEF